MIYTIIHGITEHTVGRIMFDDWKKYNVYDFVSGKNMTKNEVWIESMVVKEPSRLVVANFDNQLESVTNRVRSMSQKMFRNHSGDQF